MDCHMPEMDGYEATRAIRAREGKPQPAIVALTASVTPEDRQRCLDAGMDDYLPKPIDAGALAAILLKHAKPNRDNPREVRPE
mgnify:CR=1 FL=1